MNQWEIIFEKKISEVATSDDPAHNLAHFKRVVAMAKKICAIEDGNAEIVVPAAWLHDLVIVPKNSPLRKMASRMSAQKAIDFLSYINYPSEHFEAIFHAIETHSFSANIETKTLEARIVQDADRLDALGAIGIARCFATAGIMKRSFYDPADPLCEKRPPDDSIYTVDHFYQKLFKIGESLKTEAGREEGRKRIEKMRGYLEQLLSEIRA